MKQMFKEKLFCGVWVNLSFSRRFPIDLKKYLVFTDFSKILKDLTLNQVFKKIKLNEFYLKLLSLFLRQVHYA